MDPPGQPEIETLVYLSPCQAATLQKLKTNIDLNIYNDVVLLISGKVDIGDSKTFITV